MKTLSCDLCDHTAQGDSFDDWMNNLKPHYAEAHADVMQAHASDSPEQMQAKMMAWMDENKARFESDAVEVV